MLISDLIIFVHVRRIECHTIKLNINLYWLWFQCTIINILGPKMFSWQYQSIFRSEIWPRVVMYFAVRPNIIDMLFLGSLQTHFRGSSGIKINGKAGKNIAWKCSYFVEFYFVYLKKICFPHFSQLFLIVKEDPRNNKWIESGLSELFKLIYFQVRLAKCQSTNPVDNYSSEVCSIVYNIKQILCSTCITLQNIDFCVKQTEIHQCVIMNCSQIWIVKFGFRNQKKKRRVLT